MTARSNPCSVLRCSPPIPTCAPGVVVQISRPSKQEMHRLLIRLKKQRERTLAERRPYAWYQVDVDFAGDVQHRVSFASHRMTLHIVIACREPVRIRSEAWWSRRVWPGRRRCEAWSDRSAMAKVEVLSHRTVSAHLILWWRTGARRCFGSSRNR